MRRCALVLTLITWHSIASASDGGIYQLLQQRMGLMKAVAAHKWLHHLPIEDVDRETMVIKAVTYRGLRYGVTARSLSDLFLAQISAAKEIQRYWFSTWRRTSPPNEAPDLETELRPALTALGTAIVDALALESPNSEEASNVIEAKGLSQATREQLLSAVRAIEYYDNRLEQILDVKYLRVGTTGDYAPFSFHSPHNDGLTGIDVDLAFNLAQTLGVEVKFVTTTWPSLTEDLLASQFDIAMSGVSRNAERQQIGYFSLPYHRGGKTPISRCVDKERFANFELIDRSGTRVIVNPGGTNMRFVEQRIRHAEVIVHNDNRTIFGELVSGRADVMVTDRIEVQLKTRLNPTLCSTMPKSNFTVQDKAYFMPKDRVLKQAVDNWLRTRLFDGTVAELFFRHLQQPLK